MVDTATVRTIVGVIGNIISLCLFLSPIPTFLKIVKQQAVQEFKPDPYVATLLNCALWSFYGLPFVKEDSILVTTINSVGLIIEIVYVCIFFMYSPMEKRRKIVMVLTLELIFVFAVVLVAFLAFPTPKKRAIFVGILCVILNIIMYASPLTVMRMVIKTKSVKYMPFFLSLANLCNGIIWVIYAMLKFDINVVLPNSLGAISGMIQIFLYAKYYKTTQWDNDEDNSRYKHEVEISSAV
uniref:Bidirectional sugar transporter SWEET n=2 Tax=Manihot esculenta TaxID=3983 RepID=A0A2C9VRZ1_MANES